MSTLVQRVSPRPMNITTIHRLIHRIDSMVFVQVSNVCLWVLLHQNRTVKIHLKQIHSQEYYRIQIDCGHEMVILFEQYRISLFLTVVSFLSDLPLNISEHDLMIKNKTYQIYLSNFELPNIIFAATVDNYLEATKLISQMNEHPSLHETNSNRIQTK